MSIETPENKPEVPVESEATIMSQEDAEKRLGEMDEYIKSLKAVVSEKQGELLTLKEKTDINRERIEQLEAEIQELQEEVSKEEEWSKEGREVLDEGGEFLDRKID